MKAPVICLTWRHVDGRGNRLPDYKYSIPAYNLWPCISCVFCVSPIFWTYGYFLKIKNRTANKTYSMRHNPKICLINHVLGYHIPCHIVYHNLKIVPTPSDPADIPAVKNSSSAGMANLSQSLPEITPASIKVAAHKKIYWIWIRSVFMF